MERKVYGFLDNLILTCNGKFSLLLRKYSLLAVNLLTRSHKISESFKNNFFKLNLGQND